MIPTFTIYTNCFAAWCNTITKSIYFWSIYPQTVLMTDSNRSCTLSKFQKGPAQTFRDLAETRVAQHNATSYSDVMTPSRLVPHTFRPCNITVRVLYWGAKRNAYLQRAMQCVKWRREGSRAASSARPCTVELLVQCHNICYHHSAIISQIRGNLFSLHFLIVYLLSVQWNRCG